MSVDPAYGGDGPDCFAVCVTTMMSALHVRGWSVEQGSPCCCLSWEEPMGTHDGRCRLPSEERSGALIRKHGRNAFPGR